MTSLSLGIVSTANFLVLLAAALPALGAAAQPGTQPAADKSTPAAPVRVLVETEKGSFELELDAARAPATVANFLRYVDAGLYDGGVFHRTVTREPDNQPNNAVKIEVIQASADPAREAAAFAPIALERTRDSGIAHLDGTVSMARDTPDSAAHEIFVCIGDQPELDFGGRRNPDGQGFAAFGRVVRGMETVRAIHRAPAQGQKLAPAVRIVRARRVTESDAGAVRP